MARTIPDDVAEGVGAVMRIFQAMVGAAKRQAKCHPTHDGLYPVTVIMNASGEIMCDEAGEPLVVIPPLTLARTSDTTAEFFHTEQRLSPKQAAEIAGVHKATLQRAVNGGELPKPTAISSRRVVHRLTDIQDWIAKRGA
jgi:predicted DNA-binding transcriptional regulator AlpA